MIIPFYFLEQKEVNIISDIFDMYIDVKQANSSEDFCIELNNILIKLNSRQHLNEQDLSNLIEVFTIQIISYDKLRTILEVPFIDIKEASKILLKTISIHSNLLNEEFILMNRPMLKYTKRIIEDNIEVCNMTQNEKECLYKL